MEREIRVQAAGFKAPEVLLTPDDYGLSRENLQRVIAIVRATEIIHWERHNFMERDQGRPIGFTSCMEVGPGDEVFWQRLKGRQVFGKFVSGHQAVATSFLTVNVKPVRGVWRVIRAYTGRHSPAFPGDRNEAQSSRRFWDKHALLEGTIPVDRKNNPRLWSCPW